MLAPARVVLEVSLHDRQDVRHDRDVADARVGRRGADDESADSYYAAGDATGQVVGRATLISQRTSDARPSRASAVTEGQSSVSATAMWAAA